MVDPWSKVCGAYPVAGTIFNFGSPDEGSVTDQISGWLVAALLVSDLESTGAARKPFGLRVLYHVRSSVFMTLIVHS